MKKILLITLSLFCSFSMAQIKMPSYIAVEANSGKVLFSQAAEEKRPISSLAQVATALVALDWIERTKVSFDQLITVPQEAYIIQNIGNPMKLRPGDRISLRDALFSTLLGSDNLSALTIAYHVGRDLSYRRGSGSPIDLFVKEMNNLASALGMKKTRFYAPHGIDAQGSVSESCAVDMALLGVYSMRNKAFAFIAQHPGRRIGVETATSGVQQYDIVNTNTMLGKDQVDGIKTGNSKASGPCLMISGTRNARPIRNPLTNTTNIYPQRMVIVVLGTENRYGLAKQLYQDGWRAWDAWANTGMQANDQKEFLRLPSQTTKPN